MSSYHQLVDLLDRHAARYRVVDHEPEGRTEDVSRLLGTPGRHRLHDGRRPAGAAQPRPDLPVVADAGLLADHPEIAFNAAHLDRSILMATATTSASLTQSSPGSSLAARDSKLKRTSKPDQT